MNSTFFKYLLYPTLVLLMISGVFKPIFAQGNIYGLVANSDLSIPSDGNVYFVGYLDDNDEEIRIENCIGAGYDAGNWYDDFQNYLTEAAGNPYDYHFFNISNQETAVLSGLIPANSFQEEDIQLQSGDWIPILEGIDAIYLQDGTVKITWNQQPGTTYRIYRRLAGSQGSLFRIDDPSGSLSNPGISDTVFIDSSVIAGESYNYLLIPVVNDVIGFHSDLVSVGFICGDADSDGKLNLLDAIFVINYLYRGGPEPLNLIAVDINEKEGLNLLDVIYLINYLYRSGPEPVCNFDQP